ncbi:hypothetical protein GC096_30705 [Paenibacillus sp. LMG 31461]|uniref:Uncharacterized protein n=1 Tax=Paenibacillus plantarum TaxID=2654975 RepID=A0ABX1XK83_9BACL|nr:hypothetical protein [Paenibacillus plantarum]NOU68401.1 hypothetical protein [Paenibacillus plantarum]
MVTLEPCDVIFVKRRRDPTLKDRIIGELVKWATKSEYSHVAYFVCPGVIFEANAFRSAGYGSLDAYSDFIVKRLSFAPEVRLRILNQIRKTEGAQYGWGEVIALLFRKRLGIPVYFDSPQAFECAEQLVKAVHAETEIWIVAQTTGDISPQDLWESPWLEIKKD